MRFIKPAIIVMLGCLLSACAQKPNVADLRARADSYLGAIHRNDQQSVWQIWSPKMRSDEGGEAEFKADFAARARGINLSRYKIAAANIEKGKGVVLADVTYVDSAGNKASGREKLKFEAVNGAWYYAGSETF